MCWMMAIPIAMAAGGAALNSYSGAKMTAAQNDAMRRQNREAVKQMNYEDANLKADAQDAREQLRDDLTQNNMQSVRNLGTLRAAIGESGLEGNSMKRVMAVTHGDYMRQSQGLTDNYTRDYSAIFGKRLQNIEGTKSAIDSTREVKGPSGAIQTISAALSIGQAAYSASQSGTKSDTKAPISAATGTSTGHK